MRKAGAIIAGIIALFVIVVAVELLGPMLHALPAHIRAGDPVATSAWLMSAPLAVQGVIVLAWFLGALGGGYAALRISQWSVAAWIIAALDLTIALANTFQFTHPLWMQIGAVTAPLLGGWAATRLDWREDESIDAPIEL